MVDTEPPSVQRLFEPRCHLAPSEGTTQFKTMADLGYENIGISKVAVTDPFPLFTLEGVTRIREELFKHETIANNLYSDTLNPSCLRGMCPKYAPFTQEAWNHPEVRRRVNEVAGLNLEIIFSYEIGHTNVQLGPRGWRGLRAEPDLPDAAEPLGSVEEIQPTLMVSPNWHKDSYPFVCILMLTESAQLEGGRTVIQKSDGTNIYCPLPPIGYAMVLQGGYIRHAISPTDRMQERISMVTSYRPADATLPDISVLRTIRTMSDVKELHRQWCHYRLRVLAARAEALAGKLADPSFEGTFEDELSKFILEQGDYMTNTLGEMIRPVASVRTDLREKYMAWKATENAGL